MPTRSSCALAGLALLSGCSLYEAADDGPPVAEGWQRVAVIDPPAPRELDILFVIDNSGSMEMEQAALIDGFSVALNVLASVEGGLPDLHIAVVSTDVGAGPFGIDRCVGDGDDGRFWAEPRTPGCSAPAGAFIVDRASPAGGRDRNYPGSLAETFACIANLGTEGCGFGQPLESMRRALSGAQPFNRGFLRAGAHLLIAVLADEDDCSSRDTAMFDPAQTSVSDPLGPLSSFRCFELGVTCEVGNRDPRAPGARTGCAPQERSAYMHGVQPYVDFVRGLKPDAPGGISVALLTGGREPVVVGIDPERPEHPALLPACVSSAGPAAPAVRLGWFAEQFPARNTTGSTCDARFDDVIVGVADLVGQATATRCLSGAVTGGIDELVARCRGFDVLAIDTDAEQRTPLPMCDEDAGATPCLRLVADLGCTLSPARARVEVVRGGPPPPPATVVVLECPVR